MFDLHLLSKKISSCKKRLEYTSLEVSEATGIPLKRLAAFEEAQLEPTGDEILILADFFKEDYRYFISNQQVSASENTDSLYRQFGTEFSKYDRRAIQEFLYLCECEQDVWDLLGERKSGYVPPPKPQNLKVQADQVAKEVRLFLGYKEEELVRNIFDDFRQLGIHIFRRKLSNSNISGVFLIHPVAGKCVLINSSEDLYRQNFTIAHEIAHSIFDTDEVFNVSFAKDGKDPKEIRANTFAACFLMPEKAIRGLKVNYWSSNEIIKVAEQLKVNAIALLYRLKSLKLINQEQLETFRQLKVQRASKKDPELVGLPERLVESKKALLELGLSSVYVRKCHEAYSKNLISQSRLAEMLLTDEFELPTLLDLFKLKLIYEF